MIFANFADSLEGLRNPSQLQAFTRFAICEYCERRAARQARRETQARHMTGIASRIADTGDVRFFEMIFPEQANHYGTLFGGHALSLMGKAAFVAASRRARAAVVLATSEKIEFRVPVRVGELVELTARVERVGRSSMTVAVDLVSEALLSGRRSLAVRGSFEMVAVDNAGQPTPIGQSPAIQSVEETPS
jgi:acyl-CoA hydrolase